MSGWNFDAMHEKARSTWTELLDRATIEGGAPDERTTWYTGVYHSFLSPNLFSDEDGNYMGFDGKVHSLAGKRQHAQYANFSDWDIYRNTVQLQALFDPAVESDMMQSLVNDAVESGWYPRWPAANDVTYVMGGDSPVIVLSSSYAFGAKDFDVATALKYMVKAGTEPGKGPHGDSERPFLADYLKLGYVPNHNDSIAASRTLEYASADFAVAQFAKNTGHDAEYKKFMKQSENWKNLVDPETHWIRPRNADGTWQAGFDPEHSLPKRPNAPVSTDQNGFEEGNTYQYTFMIPFDYPAISSPWAARTPVAPRLDKFFLKLRLLGRALLQHGERAGLRHALCLRVCGAAVEVAGGHRAHRAATFKTTPEGLPGNDDLGATSGVYVWNALGLYPGVPGVGGLLLGTPMFPSAAIHMGDGRTLSIRAAGTGPYVQQVCSMDKRTRTHGCRCQPLARAPPTLEFTLSPEPNKQRGQPDSERPPAWVSPQK